MSDMTDNILAVVYDDYVDVYLNTEVYHLHRDEVVFGGGGISVKLEDGTTIRVSKELTKYYGLNWEYDPDDDRYDDQFNVRDET